MMRAALMLIPFLLGGLACSNEPTGAPSIAGTYTLRSINGAALPWLSVGGGPSRFEVTGATAILDEGGTFTVYSFTRYILPSGELTTHTDEEAGTFVRDGITLTMRHVPFGGVQTAIIVEGTLTWNASEGTRVYSR